MRVRSGPVRLTFVSLDTRHPMVAFAIGGRFGTAVERNRARRRLRAAFAAAWDPGDPLGAYQISATRAALSVPAAELRVAIGHCLRDLLPAGPPARSAAGESVR